MSGELTPAESQDLLRELHILGPHVVDTVDRIGDKLGSYIEWLENRVQQLEGELQTARGELALWETEA